MVAHPEAPRGSFRAASYPLSANGVMRFQLYRIPGFNPERAIAGLGR